MDEQQQQLVERIKQAQNILVTVSSNPSVDQLAAAIGLTLALNKLNKHGTAVFSGTVPSTIEFLKPAETLEKNTDSLRDFIIALDKSKADKLRYKVEDEVVRIFITPYKTSISEKDLDFSQGDFNVDVVVALGVTEQQDLDTAITAHGRILHDATVASVSTVGQGSLGGINWVQPTASSLSEMMVLLVDGLDNKILDGQIATALLTGIVATTERFRNDKTTPKTMSASAELMAAGANQQLIATELEAPAPPATPETPAASEPDATVAPEEQASDTPDDHEAPKPEPGTLEIAHEEKESDLDTTVNTDEFEEKADQPQVHVDSDGKLTTGDDVPADTPPAPAGGAQAQDTAQSRQRMTEAPQMSDAPLTANTEAETLDPPTEELSLPSPQAPPLLSHTESVLPDNAQPAAPMQPAPADWQPPADPIDPHDTLAEIEQAVDSPHLQASAHTDPQDPQDAPPDVAAVVDDARSAVEAALNGAAAPDDPLAPIAALNAQPLGDSFHTDQNPAFQAPPVPQATLAAVPNMGFSEPTPGTSPADETLDMPLPPASFGQQPGANPFGSPGAPPSVFPGASQQSNGQQGGQTPPPPVPPPMLPPLQ